MGRIADVLNELALLGAMGTEVSVPAGRVVQTESDEEPEPVEDYDPVALLTAGFKVPVQDLKEATEDAEEAAEEDVAAFEREVGDGSTDVTVPEYEEAEDSAEEDESEVEVDLAATVAQLREEVEAMAEQMNSVLLAVRDLDALLKAEE